MSANYYNNIVDSMTNTSRFHGFVDTKSLLIGVGCGFSSFLTDVVKDIASKLGVVNPKYQAFKTNAKNGALAGDDQILIGQEYAAALEHNSSPFTKEEVEGVLAHEIGHLALDHPNSPLDEHCFDDLFDGRVKATSDEHRSCLAAANKEMEKEADLFTLRNPSLGKKLIQVLKKWLLLDGPSAPVSIFDSHPTTEERLDYLTKAYCDKITYNDADLC